MKIIIKFARTWDGQNLTDDPAGWMSSVILNAKVTEDQQQGF